MLPLFILSRSQRLDHGTLFEGASLHQALGCIAHPTRPHTPLCAYYHHCHRGVVFLGKHGYVFTRPDQHHVESLQDVARVRPLFLALRVMFRMWHLCAFLALALESVVKGVAFVCLFQVGHSGGWGD